MERTLVLVKPDGVQRGLAFDILCRLERRGLRIAGLKLIQVTPELAGEHYKEHVGKGFYAGLIAYITSAPVVAAVFEGPSAIAITRATMGKTNPVLADAGTIRGDLGIETGRNLIHGSDGPDSAAREVALFFKPEELRSYARDVDRWIVE